MENLIKEVAIDLNITAKQVGVVLDLLNDKNTIPFIARYRKEATGNLDENMIFEIKKVYDYQESLKNRKEDVIRLIDEKGLMNDQLRDSINACTKLVEVDQIYKPYQEKKKTKASIAIELGLEELAKSILSNPNLDVKQEAKKYITDEVKTIEEAINYAQDIIAQKISENMSYRQMVVDSYTKHGIVVSKVKKKHDDEREVYKIYYDYSERYNTIANHRILGINRAVNQKVITMNITMPNDYNVSNMYQDLTKKQKYVNEDIILEAIEDGYQRLILKSVIRQLWALKVEEASTKAIDLFSMNIEKLLMEPPLKNQTILGFDPGFRTGCKLAVIDKQGQVLHIDVIFPHEPQNKSKESILKMMDIINKFNVDVIAIGNGTASRESEYLVAQMIKDNNLNVNYAIVSESGASVYSASKIAQSEFPDLKVEYRSAISIARRLLDPLGELIKIDPKSIGVGQYQHDVNQKELSEKLDFSVMKIVNEIGVDINSASSYLLSHISGLNQSVANNILEYRYQNDGFKSRKEIKKVAKLGAKSFVQAAGFLRIESGKEPLDNTTIHPESYDIAYQILNILDLDIKDIKTEEFKKSIETCNIEQFKSLDIDQYTLKDILNALKADSVDVRDYLRKPTLRKDILKIEDLTVNTKLEGIVRNVVDFGVFVDIGLKNDALLHLSKISKDFIKHPSEVLSVNDIIEVTVLSIDLKKNNVSLTMIGGN